MRWRTTTLAVALLVGAAGCGGDDAGLSDDDRLRLLADCLDRAADKPWPESSAEEQDCLNRWPVNG